MAALIALVLLVLAAGLVAFGAPPVAIAAAASVWAALLWLRSRFADHGTARLS